MNYRTIRACQVCGKHFSAAADNYYCPDCAKLKKLDTVVQERTCQDCGAMFLGGPRAKRCPECRIIARKEYDKEYRKRGSYRSIGSKDTCSICGEEYIVNSGGQKYCSEKCQRIGVLQWQREHKKGYNKKPKIKAKKQDARRNQEKVCVYCLRHFKTNSTSSLCSDYCRGEQKKLVQCIADVKRGYNRDLKKYEKMRDKYREEVRKNSI